jgi:hypothetical protein
MGAPTTAATNNYKVTNLHIPEVQEAARAMDSILLAGIRPLKAITNDIVGHAVKGAQISNIPPSHGDPFISIDPRNHRVRVFVVSHDPPDSHRAFSSSEANTLYSLRSPHG